MLPRADTTVEQLHLHKKYMAFQSLPRAAVTALQVSGWFMVGVASAAGVSTFVPSPSRAETVLSDFVTTGADLSGAQVTASFWDGRSEVLTWQATAEAEGGVAGDGWSLGQRFDSFNYPWALEVASDWALSSLSIDLLAGNALFDVEPSVLTALNTAGSKAGAVFSVKPGSLLGDAVEPSRVTYSEPVDISQGDLFTVLQLDWEEGFGNGALEFVADTDSGTNGSPVQLVNAPIEVPEAIAIPLAPADRVTMESPAQSVPEGSSLMALFGWVGLMGTKAWVVNCQKA